MYTLELKWLAPFLVDIAVQLHDFGTSVADSVGVARYHESLGRRNWPGIGQRYLWAPLGR